MAEDLRRLNAAYDALDDLPVPTDPLALARAMSDIYEARIALGTKSRPNPYIGVIRKLEAARAVTK